MRRIDSGFLRETIAGIHSSIELPFLDCVLRLQEIYDGVEFTDQCVQEPEKRIRSGVVFTSAILDTILGVALEILISRKGAKLAKEESAWDQAAASWIHADGTTSQKLWEGRPEGGGGGMECGGALIR